MSDVAQALETAGLAAIGRGETTLGILKGVKNTIRIYTDKAKKAGRNLFRFENLFGKKNVDTSNFEFTDSESFPFLPPLDTGVKTRLGIYLDELLKNHPPDSDVFFDKYMRLYIQEQNNPKKLWVYSVNNDDIKEVVEEGFVDIDPEQISVKKYEVAPLSKWELKDARATIEKKLRALKRDNDRTYTGKKITMKDINPFSLIDPEKEKQEALKKQQLARTGYYKPIYFPEKKPKTIQETLQEIRKVKGKSLNFNAYELLNDAAKYEQWINTGTKSLLGYDTQDLEDQIKAIRAISNSKIRKYAVEVINKALRGEPITVDDLVRDLQRISKVNPIALSAGIQRLQRGDLRDTSQIYDDLISELVTYAPSMGKIFADQAVQLAGKAAVGSLLKYIPKVGGVLSGAVGAIGGSVGLISSLSVSLIVGIVGLTFKFLRVHRITEENSKERFQELNDRLTNLQELVQQMAKQNIENDKKLIEQARKSRRDEEISREQLDNATAIAERDIAANEQVQNIFSRENAMSRKDRPTFGYEGDKVIFNYGRKDQLMAYRTIPRSAIEYMRLKYREPKFMKAYGVKTMLTPALKKNDPVKWQNVNAARIAYIEEEIGRPIVLLEPGKPIEVNVEVDPEPAELVLAPPPILPQPTKEPTSFLKSLTDSTTISAFSADLFNKLTKQPNWKPDFSRLNILPPPLAKSAPIAPKRKRESHVKIEPIDTDVDVSILSTGDRIGSTGNRIGILHTNGVDASIFFSNDNAAIWNFDESFFID